jgi:hypothetical protein
MYILKYLGIQLNTLELKWARPCCALPGFSLAVLSGKLLRERVWENVCISWSNGGDYSGKDSFCVSLGCLPYFITLLGIKKNTMLHGIPTVTLLSIPDLI